MKAVQQGFQAGIAALILTCLAMPAAAHVNGTGVVDSYGGLLHPYTEPAHILNLIALGFMLTQQGKSVPPLGWSVFCGTVLLGLLINSLGANLDVALLLLICGFVLGVLVAWRPRLPLPAALLVSGIAGLLLGMDSVSILEGWWQTAIWMISVATGLAIALLIVMGWGDYFTRDWQKIGIRVIGSWIAAAALLVFTLSLRQ